MTDTKKIKLHTIPIDSQVTIPVSGEFHKRLVGLYFNYVSKFEPSKFEEMLKALEDHSISSLKGDAKVDATGLQTLLMLITTLEKAFVDAKFDKEDVYDIPIED